MFSISVACFGSRRCSSCFHGTPGDSVQLKVSEWDDLPGTVLAERSLLRCCCRRKRRPEVQGIEAGRPLGCLGAKTHGIHCGILVLHVWNGWGCWVAGMIIASDDWDHSRKFLRLAPVRISMNIMEWLWKVWNSLIWTIWVTGHVVMSQTIIFEVLLDSQISMNDPIKLPWSRFLIGSCEIGIGSRFVSLFLSDDVASIITPWWHGQSSA